MCMQVLWIMCVSLLFCPSLGCYQCFVDVEESSRLCWGHVMSDIEVRNVDRCFFMLDRKFNNNIKVIEAAKVGKGYDQQLSKILNAEILPLAKEFDMKKNYDYVYEKRLQTAADNFIAAASKLPRVSGCFPPCGFQSAGAVYNCMTCHYDSCEFPLDCPIEEIQLIENSRSRMWCKVPFDLPADIEVIWRVAKQMKTQQIDQFADVTSGVDRLLSIPSARLQHQGTYQCEILSGGRSIVRLYYYIAVTPQAVTGHIALQEIFEQSLLPGGQLVPGPGSSPPSLQLPMLLTACLTTSLLLLFLSLGALYLSSTPEQTSSLEETDRDEDLGVATEHGEQ
ncbi:sperm acrosome membrane-associated protein 6 [Embiotoca jacksoni]|uniref:sperm acrosome membrane-associated protein 6 n=1 Tax=Embiotoca jacksoni TaxID=100190 RepID=UPI0037049FEF